MKHIYLSVLLLFFLMTFGVAQNLPVTQFRTDVGKLTFSLEAAQQVHSVGDTLNVTLDILNNDSTRSVAIFDNREYLPSRDDRGWAVLSAGGNWSYDPGIFSQVALYVLEPLSSIKMNLPIVIDSLRVSGESCPPPVSEDGRTTFRPTRYFSLLQGYYPDDGLLKQLDLASLKREGFRKHSSGWQFNDGLKSILLGPLPLVVIQDRSR